MKVPSVSEIVIGRDAIARFASSSFDRICPIVKNCPLYDRGTEGLWLFNDGDGWGWVRGVAAAFGVGVGAGGIVLVTIITRCGVGDAAGTTTRGLVGVGLGEMLWEKPAFARSSVIKTA